MPAISASLVKQLRDKTGLGMMDCKKALEETGGDLDAAEQSLRTKGFATAERKAGRATAEGLIGIVVAEDRTAAAMVEIQCETDFCARNDEFRQMVRDVAQMALEAEAGPVACSDAMDARLKDALGKIGENMSYARGVRIEAARVGSYLHHNGKVGVLLGVQGAVTDETLADLCMHIAFADPMALQPDDVPPEVVQRETDIAKQQAIDSGKPPEIAEKMVAGKVRKFLTQNTLLDQPFVKDESKTVRDVLGDARAVTFARFGVGQASPA